MGRAVGKITYSMLDIAKFLCALLILFYHYFTENRVLPWILEESLSLYAVAVALFMTISGFLTFNKLAEMENTAEKWRYVKKQVFRILKIYLLWSIVYVVFQLTQWNWSDISFSFVFWKVQGWIFNSTYFTIWFMPSLAFGLILAFWMSEKLPKWLTVVLAICLYATGSLISNYYSIGQHIPAIPELAEFATTWLGGSRGWLFFGTPLVLLGRGVVKFKNKVHFLPTALLSFACMVLLLAEALLLRNFFGNTGIDMVVMMVPVCFSILSFLISVKLPDSSAYAWMRKMSVLIFVTQRIFLTVIPAVVTVEFSQKMFENRYVGAVIVCGGTFLLSAMIIMLSNKIKFLRNLY